MLIHSGWGQAGCVEGRRKAVNAQTGGEWRRGHKAGHYASRMAVAAAAKSLQSCPTLCNPIDGSPRGSTIPRILQTRVLEWGVIAFSTRMAEEPPNTLNATDQPFSNSPLRQGFSASALSAGLILGLGGCPVQCRCSAGSLASTH